MGAGMAAASDDAPRSMAESPVDNSPRVCAAKVLTNLFAKEEVLAPANHGYRRRLKQKLGPTPDQFFLEKDGGYAEHGMPSYASNWTENPQEHTLPTT